MNATIIGSQFGDEGKGGAVDRFGERADVVVRYQGGDNAGHTVVHGGETYELRLVPSGVVRGTTGLLGDGCVVNLATLFEEIDRLRERGLDPDVRVSGRAHVVLPYHRALDLASEAARGDDLAVGTTGNGIGPAYEDKAGRRGIRAAELLEPAAVRERLEHVVPKKRAVAEAAYGLDPDDPGAALAPDRSAAADAASDAGEGYAVRDLEIAFDVDAICERLRTYGERLADEGMVVDGGSYLADRRREGARILFEGAQATHLDLDRGDYPYVTSSNPTAGGAIVGSGVPPAAVADGVTIGVAKAYLSRVGRGPMPTELDDETAAALRERGGEYGTVTGRPRRIGWLDLPMLRDAARANGFDGLVLNHVDALAGLERVRICEAYELDGERVTTTPPTAAARARCAPAYRTVDGWSDRDWSAVAAEGYDALPANARAYVEHVGEALEVPVYAVGVGPGREETIVRRAPFASTECSSADRVATDRGRAERAAFDRENNDRERATHERG
ncbi:adenylosuccinate synthase [Halovivax sp.]|uniref:adenylosuccinate synthase n=1 Tax=Halovivax sp. TaxID=1935978 RepID=UPI0025BDF5DF|nr:adenylosuccinate synthase [Halovivax sp.]